MGIEVPGYSQPNDGGSSRLRVKTIQSQNSDVCVEEALPGVSLNLGCGKVRWDGWVNVDLNEGDLKCDITKLDLPSDHADRIAAIHVIEHFHAWEVPDILGEWGRVLKPGGQLILELPCMDKVIEHMYLSMSQGIPMSKAMSWYVFWGNPKYRDPLMVHKWGYTKEMMIETLKGCGFKDPVYSEPKYHFPQRDMRVKAFK